ncbi:MAG: AzlC family ABC transporter permease [Lachnospiraceae bacterium]|nr:AzlC family ABC transporter permease [Lachnospiraceae bacterium]
MFKKGLNDGIAIALGYLSVSFTFGLIAVSGGLSPIQATLISLLCLTSAGQFAGLDIMIAGGSLIELALSQLIINLRYSLMSISLSQKADESLTIPNRLLVGYGITDEIFAVAMSKNKTVGKVYMAGLIFLPVLGWTLGTFLGAVIGSVIPPLLSESLGIAIYAMFLAIIIPPAKEEVGIVVVLIVAIVLSCIIYYTPISKVITSGFKVIIVGILASLVGAIFFPVDEEEVSDDNA